ncbi:MAG: YabP/YqfC family sporulation protein [Eubacteriales bacterium]|nr:YabP/YqfC family sporulation protein [Eubacteriales bacterium]
MSRKEKAAQAAKNATQKRAKELIVDSLKLPRDMMMGASIVTVMGADQVLVENYRGILEYTPDCIMLQGKACRIAICGQCLRIVYYTNEDMKIEGKISEIKYL